MQKKILLILIAIVFLIPFFTNAAGDPLIAYKLDDKWHILDEEGSEIFPPMDVIDVGGYREGFFRVFEEIDGRRRWTYKNMQGETVITPDADILKDFHEGKAVIIKVLDAQGHKMLFGMIDSTGAEFLPMKYKDMIPFKEGLAYIMDDFKRGFIDHTGEMKIELHNTVGYPFYEGIAAVSNMAHKVGYMNKEGKLLIPFAYDEPHQFSEGLVAANQGQFFGYIDTNGVEAIEFQYKDAKPFNEGRAFVAYTDIQHNYIYGLIDKKGTMLVDYKYKYVTDFSEGVAAVSATGKYGFIDMMGQTIIGDDFSFTSSFKNGLAWASRKDEGKFGFIDKSGKYVIKVPKADKYIDLRTNTPLY